MSYPVVQITWIDSHSMDGWETEATVMFNLKRGLPVCTTVGFLIYENDQEVAIAQS